MEMTTEHLNTLLKELKITNSVLAKSLGVDPSLVSRWTTGARLLRYASDMTDRLARYLMDRILQEKGEMWLIDNIQTHNNADLLCSLKLWISFDEKVAGKPLGIVHRYTATIK
jgi:plasmid maintenance system antidote protein VapI